ncbi:hypothetical protein [Cellulomonas aerilata]|uniref:Uncharacterized protein n=1 Tax=Cellulomonas aerilata TaxID=515326 RepID=A0A512D9C0_9CELL|nr:hypothetical protein [Cellulomonas aerilata]GEO33082.1 hypothetical protein CAE01nite_08070 [Cellulomonas aerilata]
MNNADETDRVPRTLVDEAGRHWTTRWASWASEKQVRQFLGRGHLVCVRAPGEELQWLKPDEALRLWDHAAPHLEVPGIAAATPDEHGRTWGAHVFRHKNDRLLVLETFC